MRFVWLARRHPVEAPWAQLIAIVLTVGAIAAVSTPLRSHYDTDRTAPIVERAAGEHLTFIVPPHSTPAIRTPAQRADRPAQELPRRPLDPPPVAPVTSVVPPLRVSEPAALHPPPIAAARIATVPPAAGSEASSPNVGSPSRRAVGPLAAPSGFSASRPLDAAARDSSLVQLMSSVPMLARARRPTQAEKDVALREQSRLEAIARDELRPVIRPMTAGGIAIPLPLFSSVKSRKQQVRDSIVNADFLQRLARLAERARAKQDSIRRADSLAAVRRAPSRARSDSTAPPRAPSSPHGESP
jgi:hypothetical protein